jgi:demethylmenaquinone methyltransferase / 2-methoxy-6-polyprenyl-1,4-benzoquinol methylase
MTNPTYSERMAAQAATPSPENAFATDLFLGLPARYDLLAELLSFRQNARWRHELVDHIVDAHPQRILDVATGTAGVAIELARRTGGEVVGVDLSEAMLGRGRARVAAAGLDGRITLKTGRAEALPFENESFDAVSFTYLLRYVADPQATMRELARVLRPGGVMSSLDFFVPPQAAWLAAWRLYTRVGLPALGWMSGGAAWGRVGRFLGPNIEGHYSRWPLPRIAEAWGSAGLVNVRWRVMSVGGGLVMWGTKK